MTRSTLLLTTISLAALTVPFLSDPAPAAAATVVPRSVPVLAIAQGELGVAASSATGLSGCSAEQMVVVQASLARFDVRVRELASELDDATVSGPSESLRRRLAKYFHTNPGTDLKGLAARIREGHQKMESLLTSPMKVQCGHEACAESGDTARQYADTTVLCEPFFSDTNAGQVDTIFHELAHRTGVAPKDSYLQGTNVTECLEDAHAWGRFAVDGWTPVL